MDEQYATLGSNRREGVEERVLAYQRMLDERTKTEYNLEVSILSHLVFTTSTKFCCRMTKASCPNCSAHFLVVLVCCCFRLPDSENRSWPECDWKRERNVDWNYKAADKR